MRETTGGANSKYPHFPKVEIDVLLITEGNEGTKFLQEFISKRFSSCNLDRQKKEISGIFEQRMLSKLKFWQNLLEAKAFCTAANVSNWILP